MFLLNKMRPHGAASRRKARSSDAIVGPFTSDGRRLEAQIDAAPSMVRPAARGLLPRLPETILVQRVDQLGDMVCSVPAL